MSRENAIISKAAAADRFISEYSCRVREYEEELDSVVDDMYSDIGELFRFWDGDLAVQYRKKIENTLHEVEDSCKRAEELSSVLNKRAEQMRAMLEKLRRAST